MGWFGNRLMRGASNRAVDRLVMEIGHGPGTAMLALALGYACYPSASYGDNGPQDEIVALIRTLPLRPCDASTACRLVEQWLDHGTLSTAQVFQCVWNVTPDALLQNLGKMMR